LSRSRRANDCTTTPAANEITVITPAKPADRVRALVTSSGSTTIASATEPNASGLPGATASQNCRVRTAAGGQRRAVVTDPTGRTRAGERDAAPSGVPASTAAAAVPITRCGRYGTTSGSLAHWASPAATTGPRPNPAVSASADRRTLSPSSGDTSCTHAVAA